MRLRPAAVQAASTRAAILPDMTERSTTLTRWRPTLAIPRRGEDRSKVVGDRWAAGRAGLRLGAPDDEAGGDTPVLEHVFPVEPVDLRAPQAGEKAVA